MIRLALFEPDIPQNCGTLMRLCACLGLPMDLIEPAGFFLDDPRMRRAGMDYVRALDLTRHPAWPAFLAAQHAAGRRLVLLDGRGPLPYTRFAFAPGDVLVLGRESMGAPAHVHAAADATLAIPMRPALRSLNVAVAAAMVAGEALRQLAAFPAHPPEPAGDAA